MRKDKKIAVVLFNLGGPDNVKAIKPFLFNLFKDKNIIRLPAVIRYPLGWLISTLRHKKASKIYAKLGGRSPILPQTQLQAKKLKETLSHHITDPLEVFIMMRYWHPMTPETILDIKKYNPDKIILLPLYPQLSTTTTQSSFEEWDKWQKKCDIKADIQKICCYPTQKGFIEGYVDLICQTLKDHPKNKHINILFSAHGIPQDCVDDGDPYEEQVHKSVDKIVDKLRKKFSVESGENSGENALNFTPKITYQSKVGPKKWLLPDTESVIEDLASKKQSLCLVPIAFTSEHSETLVELDIDYKDLALELGASDYYRVPTVGINPYFISGLSDMVIEALKSQPKDCGVKCSSHLKACYKQNNHALRF